MLLKLNEFLEWVYDKEIVLFTYEVESSDFIKNSITTLNFKEPNDSNIRTLSCPIRKKDNAIFLRTIRKCLLEISPKTIITYGFKDFLNFIPGKFESRAEIYDVQLMESIIHETISHPHDRPECADLLKRFSFINSKLNKNQSKLYHKILIPSAYAYSEMEKYGLPTKYGINFYSYYDLSGTVSGRLVNTSFENKKFINPLNLPKKERNIIKAPPGFKFIITDYNAMEMRMLGFLSQDETFYSVFKSEEDIYTFIGKYIFQNGNSDIDNTTREFIKSLCFLIIYGGSEYGFANKHGCSQETAKKLIKKFYELFPKVEEWSVQIQIDILEKGYVESVFGRKRYLDLEEESALRKGQNFLVQSPANDITILALLELTQSLLEDSRVLIHLHDSITILTPEEKAQGNANIIKEIMTNPSKISDFGINNISLSPVLTFSNDWR